ncbi:MAG TPA: dUTP diphosphatase [Thermoanaerobaculales bacterium]|nr:dUTP diphosphatase [Thermoanaerobaculales bacterium]HPA81706.1 dUTP diphosphatase [Thermoanaerobaculales bacterium]HQL31184.1 dUTP diphosphatase [Thermoanaerobaculales bacterium]HQN95959.1 dUTP diphosphatase [Thermoanaerobaculales bacterium]HQP43539.1 dUTP diphosphatase [Thermoanaerobaculales bacterium]
MVEVRVRRLAHAQGLPLPDYATAGSAGADLRSAEAGDVALVPGGRLAVATGLVVEIPPGYEAQVRPRSGLALHHGLTVVNAPGTIDADYRGEVKVLLINLGSEPVVIRRGDRIAQLVVAPVTRAAFRDADELAGSDRGADGFGSTGR